MVIPEYKPNPDHFSLKKAIFDALFRFLLIIMFVQNCITSMMVTKLYYNSQENTPKIEKVASQLDSLATTKLADSVHLDSLRVHVDSIRKKVDSVQEKLGQDK